MKHRILFLAACLLASMVSWAEGIVEEPSIGATFKVGKNPCFLCQSIPCFLFDLSRMLVMLLQHLHKNICFETFITPKFGGIKNCSYFCSKLFD